MRQATALEEALGRPAHAPNGPPGAGNRILAALSPHEVRLLEPIERVRFVARHKVFETGEALRHLYFPAGALLSFVQIDPHGMMPEISLVGAEGVVDIAALLGGDTALRRTVVRIAGDAYRVPLVSARRAFHDSQVFRAAILDFAGLVIRQVSQTVVCKLSHTVEEQFCQRLLTYAEHAAGQPLDLTHEQIAEALGTRRQGITEVARRLQTQGVIAYSRGRITVLDRDALRRYSCECCRAG